MPTPRRVLGLAAVTSVLAGAGATGTAGAADTVLRLNGIGPLELGMKRSEALATGWLTNRGTGCELGGPPLPITYRLGGPGVPSGLRGVAEFQGHRLRNLSFTRGVRTVRGVTVGKTTYTRMVRRYRSDGFTASAQFLDTFRATFVNVRRGGRHVLGGFAERRIVTILGIPYVPTCD